MYYLQPRNSIHFYMKKKKQIIIGRRRRKRGKEFKEIDKKTLFSIYFDFFCFWFFPKSRAIEFRLFGEFLGIF